MSDCRLYLISPPRLSPISFAEMLREALGGGDVASFQLRLKDVDDDAIRRATDLLRPIVQAAGIAFILNDRPDLAKELGCDGVHIGQDDGDPRAARALLGPDAFIGLSVTRAEEIATVDPGIVDYVGLGPAFATGSKPWWNWMPGGRRFSSRSKNASCSPLS